MEKRREYIPDNGKRTPQNVRGAAHVATSNAEYRRVSGGDSANSVANRWLAARRGTRVRVTFQSGDSVTGLLVAFDMYSLELQQGDSPKTILVFKGPSMQLEEWGE